LFQIPILNFQLLLWI